MRWGIQLCGVGYKCIEGKEGEGGDTANCVV